MNAAEAKEKSEEIAASLERKRKVARQQEAIEVKKKEEKRHKDFEEETYRSAKSSIVYAVEHGHKKTHIVLFTSEKMYESGPDWFLENHEFAEETKRVMKELKKEGFVVELVSKTNEYRTQHESMVPDYNYYDYSCVLNISW